MQTGTPSETADSSTPAKKPRFFYGWVVLAVASIANTIAFGASSVSLAVFIRPMTETLGWTRTQIVAGVTMTNATNLAVAPITGPILDKYGARPVMLWGALVAGIAYIMLAGVSELWQFYLLYVVATSLGIAEIGSLVTTTAVSKWFVRMRGRALGIVTGANSVGAAVVVPITAFLINAIGWRSTWVALGAALIVIVVPPVFLFMRNTPESMGLRPDGDTPEAQTANNAASSARRGAGETYSWRPKQALKTGTLWMIVLSSNLTSLAFGGMLIHMVPAFTDAGMSLQEAGFAYSVYSVGAVVSKLLWGFLGERLPVRFGLACNSGARAISLVIFLLNPGRLGARVFAILSGVLSTGSAPLSAQIWADYYGRGFLGTIRGITTPFSLLSSILGPLLAAHLYDQFGNYSTAFWIYVVTLTIGTTLMVWAKPPKPPVETATAP